ncbi:hypothetical protein [Dactylosporangium sp. NPDC049140]|uniref:calcium-binding protein n=1 Tax=Dactylosporangium sp. NPDC049140 TaxID=3155647 RepID=UPI0033E67914
MSRRLWAGSAGIGLVAALAVATPASASVTGCYGDCKPGVVRVTGNLRFDAPIGVNDQITVTGDSSVITVTDPTATLTAGAGCTLVTPHQVRCASTAWMSMRIRGLDGDDVITNATAFPADLSGNDGNDRLTGGSGDDRLTGGFGADVLQGGGGSDTASYADQSNRLAVRADLDGATGDDGSADDGPAGARDTIAADVENLVGTLQNDVLIGNAGANSIDGAGGHDQIQGLGGNDSLTARGGGSIDGGAGTDDCTSTLVSQPVNPDVFTGCESAVVVP